MQPATMARHSHHGQIQPPWPDTATMATVLLTSQLKKHLTSHHGKIEFAATMANCTNSTATIPLLAATMAKCAYL